ncbi:MAG: DUF1559 domain-containing protein [Planctomycetaceae bacterium]|nr:DUF1559 domain-containing protein [Planctomycetaceae bacterium]
MKMRFFLLFIFFHSVLLSCGCGTATKEVDPVAQNAVHLNNFKLVALGVMGFESANKAFPAPFTTDTKGKPLHSWRVQILPYIGEEALYEKIRHDEPWNSEWNSQFHEQCPACFKDPRQKLAPSDATIGVVVGKNTMFRVPKPAKKQTGGSVGGTRMGEVSGGLSNTILTVECKPVCWMDPNGDPTWEEAQNGPIVSQYGLTKIGMADGQVYVIPERIDIETWRILLDRHEGGEISLPID